MMQQAIELLETELVVNMMDTFNRLIQTIAFQQRYHAYQCRETDYYDKKWDYALQIAKAVELHYKLAAKQGHKNAKAILYNEQD